MSWYTSLTNSLLMHAQRQPQKIRWRACAFGAWSGAVFDWSQASWTTDGVQIFRVYGGEGGPWDGTNLNLVTHKEKRQFHDKSSFDKGTKNWERCKLSENFVLRLKGPCTKSIFFVSQYRSHAQKNSRIDWLSFKGRGLRERRTPLTEITRPSYKHLL